MASDGGPAFPRSCGVIPGMCHDEGDFGMSLLDWFAGQALGATGMDIVKAMRRMPESSSGNTDANRMIVAGSIARDAYRIAEAMLAERERRMKGADDATA